MIDWVKMWAALGETVSMTAITVCFVLIIGMALGIILFLTRKDGLYPNLVIHSVINAYVNISRSLPFVILIIILIPFTKSIVGTIFGPTAALPALIIGASPFFARLVEIGLREIDSGVIEAAISLGATKRAIIFKVLLPESLPALVSGLTVTTVTLIGYTALAGVIGAGGLGNLAYLFGFQRGNYPMMWAATILILILVFLVQFIGDTITKHIDKRS